ncbi:hypothetical protein SLITO_v1c10090 [Spiroplasma litorale]|uniref:Lipoprotein n=1 Tax=Spiroplasma litorale TaxID=216942 RepID=A0A0K1W2R6_9MOLU|nr:hypothetical protein [Spiroplasma litorale]AKX34620.1 hypothetical protein SLITO_v1c10090 [Spiroplasma litorale]
MKKLIQLLSSMSLFATSLTTVVSCGGGESNPTKPTDPTDPTDPTNPTDPTLTDTQNQMISGAEFMSRFILASRHENLNFNLNEILSMYLTPVPTALMMPVAYKYKNTDVNFSSALQKYKTLLAPSIEKINNDNYSGVFASYVMGMYDDSFYRDFINTGHFNDSFNEQGGVGFNKKDKNNEMGILAGLDKDLKLSGDQSRRDLSWAIQDTGALTNYLLDMGYDGVNPGDTNGTSSPASATKQEKGGTNGSGYLYYNSGVSRGQGKQNALKINKTVQDKIGEKNKYTAADFSNGKYSSSINETTFNGMGSMIANTAGNLNLKGYINNFSSLKDSLSESSFGAEGLLTIANYITPMLATEEKESDLKIQSVAFSLLYNVQSVINAIQKDSSTGNELKEFLKTNGFDSTTLGKTLDQKKALGAVDILFPKLDNVKATRFYKKDKTDKNEPIENMQIVFNFLKELKKFQENLGTKELKEEFANKFFLSKSAPFKKDYSLIISAPMMGGLGEDGWVDLVKEDGSGAVNILNLVSEAYNGLSKQDTMELIQATESKYKDKSISDLSRSEKLKLIKDLGFDSSTGKYTENSFFANYFKLLTDTKTPGVNELSDLFNRLKDSTNESMQPTHEKALQYIYDKKYWDISNKSLNVTDPSEINGKMEFTLEYKGNGDADSSADQQTTKIDVPENFNPYQTNIEHQKDYAQSDAIKNKIDTSRISGKVLGKEKLKMSSEDLMKYDGKGENYKEVNHKYKVVWQNVSSDSNNPHWVVVEVKSYNNQGKEFYNIY